MDDKVAINSNKEKDLLDYEISHLVSANRNKVYLRIKLFDEEANISCEEIKEYLNKQGIVFGIDELEIKNYCIRKDFFKEVIVATGIESIEGRDAELIYNFDISKENKLIEESDGTIDFRNLNNIIMVKKDDLLCSIIPEKEGKTGMDVYGNVVNYKLLKKVRFNNGKNTYITEEGLELRASTNGCIKIIGKKVIVEDVLRVNNVDNETGNIDFIGNVIVNGDVKAGFSVKAKGDIKISGLVEGAYIEADGNIIIHKGMNGMGKGTMFAKGNITSKYIENAAVTSEKNIYSEALINSNVTANESVILKGQNAAILGGITKAGEMIYAKSVGSKINSETNLIMDLTKFLKNQSAYTDYNKNKIELKKQLNIISEELKQTEEKIILVANSNFNNKNTVQKSLVLIRLKLNNEISEIKKCLEEKVEKDNIQYYKIICKGTMYVNTRITIGWVKYRVKQDINYSKIYSDGDDINIVTLVPSDIE